MRVIDAANVQQALPEGCRLLLEKGRKVQTRNGPALVLPDPLTTVYHKPNQRVLFWEERDANPFFHLFECIWMLAGRRDVAWISRFNSNIRNYSDDGAIFNGAYGHRWRMHFGVDQLGEIIRNLRTTPTCRRQVLQMWGIRDLTHQDTKDVPCNTQAFFQINVDGRLDLMVTNRSNDLIWGAYGANAVHFSFLLEVMAHHVGVPVGRYFQVSMNTHLYEPLVPQAKQLAAHAVETPMISGVALDYHNEDPYTWGWEHGGVEPYRLAEPGNFRFFAECELFMEGTTRGYTNSFFPEVALPLLDAWTVFKDGEPDRIARAIRAAQSCLASDWRKAACEWLARRDK